MLRLCLCVLVVGVGGFGLRADDDEREQQVIERFAIVLEKNPRRGTALDKVYGFHVERGTVEPLLARYRAAAEQPARGDSGTAWMIVGLVESLRGRDAAAVEAFQAAEKSSPKNSLASFYLGQSLVLVGQPDAAAEAFERAIERQPNPADLLDVFQSLGRVYQRAQQPERALAVWSRLEKLFPNDVRVQEQIAVTLLDEGDDAAALPRFEKLARTSPDRFRQSQFQVEAAEIKVRLGRGEEALADFERLLGQLNPDHWLYRDVFRKIEDVFLRTDNQAGLAKYYEGWLEKHPEDIDTIARLARILAGQGRPRDAQQWLEKGLKLAPSRKELRRTLIDQLVFDQKFADAIQQHAALDQVEPNNADNLRAWGRLILKDTTRPDEQRKQDAAAVWRRLTATRPKDPLAAAQVADLFRQAEMPDEALALYRRAVELAPDAPQYLEYLGEYLHHLQRRDEALDTWRRIAAGPRRTAANVARLAEVLAGFGYLPEAIATNADAIKLDPRDFALQLKQADGLHQHEQFAAALAQLDAAVPLVANDDEREAILSRRIKCLLSSQKLAAAAVAMRAELQANSQADAEAWRVLARYFEADRKLADAHQAIQRALELSPQSLPALKAAAKIFEAADQLLAAVDVSTKLAVVDRRFRTEHLAQLVKLELRLGRKAQALAAGRELLAAAPGNPDHYEFFAQLSFQLGDVEEGLQTLRRAVRANPADTKPLLALTHALAEQFRTEEAIELSWRAFDKSRDIESKLGVVQQLAELYLQSNQLDKLLERLERQRREPNQQREMSLCLAQAQQAAGDNGAARQTLERLLNADARDPALLQQLVKLSEADQDFDAAVRFQRQFTALTTGRAGELQLAELLLKAGETADAVELLSRLANDERDPAQIIRLLDSLQNHGQTQIALTLCQRLLRGQPRNWELAYRAGALLAEADPNAARQHFQSLLEMQVPDDEPTVVKPPTRPGSSVNALGMPGQAYSPAVSRSYAVHQICAATGLASQQHYYGGGSPQDWRPDDFGQARMGALGWLLALCGTPDERGQFVKARQTMWEQKPSTARAAWDWFYLQQVRGDSRRSYEAIKTLAQLPDADVDTKYLYLIWLHARNVTHKDVDVAADEDAMVQADPSDQQNPATQTTPPLAADELEFMLACFRTFQRNGDTWMQYGSSPLDTVVAELELAKRKEEADKIYQAALAAAATPEQLIELLPIVQRRKDLAGSRRILHAAEQCLATTQNNSSPNYSNHYYFSNQIWELIDELGEAEAHAEILALLDRHLVNLVERKSAEAKSASLARRAWNPYGQARSVSLSLGNSNDNSAQFPLANDWIDYLSLELLQHVFQAFQTADRGAELAQHLRDSLPDGASDVECVVRRLALSYVLWWQTEPVAATRELEAASAAAPQDFDLRFDLVQLHQQRNDFARALELVDALTPRDHTVMQQRETLALRLAVRSGNLPRARQAAQRLFGLRLDADTQMQLATLLHQLGLHDLAEAVLARASRQAGNRTSVQVSVMQQRQAQGQADVAAQIAYQILRRARRSGGAQSSYSHGEDDTGRAAALQVLSRGGKLPDMIARLEKQVQDAPRSLRLLQTLAEYYEAAGNQTQHRQLQARIGQLQRGTPQMHLQWAEQLLHVGDPVAVAEHLREVARRDPQLLAARFGNFRQYLYRDSHDDVLIAVLDDCDFAALRRKPESVSALLLEFGDNDEVRDQWLALVRKVWDDFPEQRAGILARVSTEALSVRPELYALACSAIVPRESQIKKSPWLGVQQHFAHSLTGRVFDAAEKAKQLEGLERTLDEAVRSLPQWRGGRLLLAAARLRRGQVAAADSLLAELNRDEKQPLPQPARWFVAGELARQDATKPRAVQWYEQLLKTQTAKGDSQVDFGSTCAPQLAELYKSAGNIDAARQLILRFATSQPVVENQTRDEQVATRLNYLDQVASTLAHLELQIDAARLYREAFTELARPDAAGKRVNEGFVEHCRQRFTNQLDYIPPAEVPRLLADVFTTGAAANERQLMEDLLLETKELQHDEIRYWRSNVVQIETRLASPVQHWLETASQKQPAWDETLSTVRRLAEQQPENLALQITAALAALGGNQPDAEQVVARLVKLIEATPLPPPPKRGAEADAAAVRAVAAQRIAAKRQMALWLVARECFARPALQDAAERLSRRALDAARWQTDRDFLRAILRERGQIASEQQRWEVAETNWLELLRVIHASPESADDEPAAAQSLTFQQVQLTQKLALLFARHGNDRAALNLVRTALQNGPPGQEISSHNPYQSHHFHGGSWFDPATALQEVPQQIAELDRLRRKRGQPAGEMVQLLTEIVLPDKRPGELFPYADSAGRHSANPDDHVARLLVRRAVESDQVAELRQRIQTRLDQPLAELPARALLVDLGIASDDTALAAEQLVALRQRLAVDSLAETAQLASDVALAAIDVPALAPSATELLETAIANVSTKANTAGELRRQLIRANFKQGRVDEARKQLLEYRRVLSTAYTQQRHRYAQEQHNLELRKLAHEFVAADMWDDAWAAFGEAVDAAVTDRDGPALREDREAAEILARVAAHSAAKRFEMLLSWTLPTENRKSLRSVSTLANAEPLPLAADSAQVAGRSHAWLVSSSEILVAAARETGRLDELAAAIEPLSEKKLEGAHALWLLVQIAHGRAADVEPELRQLQTTRQEQLPLDRRREHFVPTTDYLLARACLHDTRLRELGQQWLRSLSASAQRRTDSRIVFHVNQELIASILSDDNEAAVRRALTPDWRLWRMDQMAGMRNDFANKQVFWLAADDRIVHVAGDSWGDFVRFAYPLTGAFEFSAEVFSRVEDDQLSFIALRYDGDNRLVWNQRDANGVAIPAPKKLGRSKEFNDLKLHVEPGHIRAFVNGVLVSDEVSDQVTAPWLELRVTGTAPVLFRNLRLTGSPIIPRELPLLPHDQVGNWYASFYDRQVQSNRPASQSGESPPRAKFRHESFSTKDESIDWLARDGELLGRMTTVEVSDKSTPRPSRLSLLRSLNDGESIQYEFFYSSSDRDEPHLVHPAIGRELFQFETDGVRPRSMPENVKPARGGAAQREVVKHDPEESVLIQPAGQARLPLKPNDWNAVRLSIVGEQVRLELNGALILQRDIAAGDRVFSFFHDQNRAAARIRNVTLIGNWPERLTTDKMVNLAATRTAAAEPERRVVEALLGEYFPIP